MERAFVYFNEVARLGSIRQAAGRLYVSASSISRQIAKLERDFEAPLLLRHAQGVKLTPAGKILLEFIQNRLRERQRLKASIDDLKDLQRGNISLNIVEGLLGGFLPRILAAFASRYPKLTYEVVVEGTDAVMRAVAEARCDIGISFHPYPHPGVEVIAEVSQSLLAMMAPSHRLAGRSELRLTDLACDFVCVPDKSFGIRHLIDHALKLEPIEINVRLETNSIDMMRQFCREGMGVSFLPAYAFEREANDGRLVGVPLSDTALAMSATKICKHAELDLTPAAQKLVRALLETGEAATQLR